MIKHYTSLQGALQTYEITRGNYCERDCAIMPIIDWASGIADMVLAFDYDRIEIFSFDMNVTDDLYEVIYYLWDIKTHYNIQVDINTVIVLKNRYKELINA